MIIKTTIRLTYNNNFIETSALKDGAQAINVINAINPFDSTGNIRLTYNNTFIETPSLTYSSQVNAVNISDDTNQQNDDQATAAINPVAVPDNDNVSDDQATDAINPVAVPDNDNVSADQLKNEGQQNFQDGTGAYIHIDQSFDKVGLIKGYTRTITFPSAIFKPADPKNIKQIKVN